MADSASIDPSLRPIKPPPPRVSAATRGRPQIQDRGIKLHLRGIETELMPFLEPVRVIGFLHGPERQNPGIGGTQDRAIDGQRHIAPDRPLVHPSDSIRQHTKSHHIPVREKPPDVDFLTDAQARITLALAREPDLATLQQERLVGGSHFLEIA